MSTNTVDGFPVPEGYALVPLEPTQAQLRAATEYSSSAGIANGLGYYRAMIAARPKTVPAPTPAATIKGWTNGSYWRNYRVDFHRDDLPEGTELYAYLPSKV